jgi:hypothetical protein
MLWFFYNKNYYFYLVPYNLFSCFIYKKTDCLKVFVKLSWV